MPYFLIVDASGKLVAVDPKSLAFTSESTAIANAERLAKQSPGTEYIVLKSYKSVVADIPNVISTIIE